MKCRPKRFLSIARLLVLDGSPEVPTPHVPPSPPKVISATELRQTERLVCNFSISRIHSQLRRLTRDSSFTPDVVLTALPFSASRVFFAFDSDFQTPLQPPQPPSRHCRGLYTGVHGPPQSSSAAELTPPPPLHQHGVPPALHGHSAGWIMFESGMEELSLLFVQRKGYGDSLEEDAGKARHSGCAGGGGGGGETIGGTTMDTNRFQEDVYSRMEEGNGTPLGDVAPPIPVGSDAFG